MAGKKRKINNRWGGLGVLLIGALLICGFIWIKTQDIYDEKNAAEQELATIKEKTEDVKRDNERLEEDIIYRQTTDYQEDLARDFSGLVGEDETIFKVGDPTKNKTDNEKNEVTGSEDPDENKKQDDAD